ncbi:MAG: hypothetical protein AAFQ89_17065 [Cyanobacteria bacterium J06626_18]
MGKRYSLLWIGTLCLLAACGSNAPPSEELSQDQTSAIPGETLPSSVSESSSTASSATARSTAPDSEATTQAAPESSAQPATESAPSTASEPQAATSQVPTEPATTAPEAVSSQDNANTASLQDTTVVPGERVGPVTLATTREDLAAIYGEDALEDTEIPVGEGFTEPGTTVNAGSAQAFSILWTDATQTQPATIRDFGPAWQTPEGLKLGTSFSELKSTAGNFSLFGLGWDYGGTVILEESNLANYDGLLLLRLRPDSEAIKQFPDAYQAVSGDKLLSSEDPNFSSLSLSVDEMIVYLTPLVQ